MEHPFHVVNSQGKAVPVTQLPISPTDFRIADDGLTFIGCSCNMTDPVGIENSIRELRDELKPHGYAVISGPSPESRLSAASGMFHEATK